MAKPSKARLVPSPPAPAIPRQAVSDDAIIRIWLHGRSPATIQAYKTDARHFLSFIAKRLRAVTVGDLNAFAGSLGKLATASRARKLSSVKSLLTHAHRLGYLTFNVGAAVRLPSVKAAHAERIMSETDVHRMLALEPDARNAAILRLLYYGGLRISEVCGLTWRDLQARDDAGQVTIYGKGGKTRVVLLPASVWRVVTGLRGDAEGEAPVFLSQRHSQLGPSGLHRVIKAAAARASLSLDVSAHWLRHAHASHALDRGASIRLVQATLGHASVGTTGRYLNARPNDSSGRTRQASTQENAEESVRVVDQQGT